MRSKQESIRIGPSKSTGESYLPNCGRMLLQKQGIGYEKEQRISMSESRVTKLPGREVGMARNYRNLLKRSKEFQAKKAYLAG